MVLARGLLGGPARRLAPAEGDGKAAVGPPYKLPALPASKPPGWMHRLPHKFLGSRPSLCLQAITAHRQRRQRTLAAVAAAAGALVLLATVEGRHQSELLTAQAAPGTLGLPTVMADALVAASQAAAASGGAGSASLTAGVSGSGSGFWHMWQQRVDDEEERVNTWRERQRSLVYEETAAEQVQPVVGRFGSGLQAARAAAKHAAAAAAAAAAADPLLDADEALAHQGLAAVAREMQLPLLDAEQQAVSAAVELDSSEATGSERRR